MFAYYNYEALEFRSALLNFYFRHTEIHIRVLREKCTYRYPLIDFNLSWTVMSMQWSNPITRNYNPINLQIFTHQNSFKALFIDVMSPFSIKITISLDICFLMSNCFCSQTWLQIILHYSLVAVHSLYLYAALKSFVEQTLCRKHQLFSELH